jgi:hypothetical protein
MRQCSAQRYGKPEVEQIFLANQRRSIIRPQFRAILEVTTRPSPVTAGQRQDALAFEHAPTGEVGSGGR